MGGLTAEQVLKKLNKLTLKNDIYVGDKLIYDGKDTQTGFAKQDLPEIKKLLKQQRTWLPSRKTRNYSLLPEQANSYRTRTLKKEVAAKLRSMNKRLKAPKDAQAYLDQGEISISESEKGQQYDIAQLLKEYDKYTYQGEIHLKPVFLQPVQADSSIVQREKKRLEELKQQSVNFQLQNKTYALRASELIRKATVSKKMDVSVEADGIRNKLSELNKSQSTLNKNYTFKTHSGSVISVKGQSYGWALDVDDETKRVQDAFEKGKTSLQAYNIYGVGYSTYGIGYHNPANHGIGYTYAEVSIKEQRIWIYKKGKLILTTHVVTGRHDTHEDTPKGVWYIMYKESPSTLEGSEAGNPNYSVKVSYWAPFTLSGCGFHDASWRKNWASDAYLKHGSGGCVNTPAKVMKTVYNNLEQNEPVIVY